MSAKRLRKGLIVSMVTALLTPAALGGLLVGATFLADANDNIAFAQSAAKPAPQPTHRTTLASLGRASAVAFIGGHIGR